MSKIHNNRLFLEKAAEIFRKKKVDSFPYDPHQPRFRPEDYYTSGHCAEFAYCFAKFAKDSGIEPTVTVIHNNQYDRETGEHKGRILSHCVVEIEHEGKTISFDINGDQAIDTWLVKVDYIYYGSPTRYELEYERLSLAEAKERLQQICLEQDVPFVDSEIDEDSKILDSLTSERTKLSERTY